MNKILVLGTGNPQLDLINECKKYGMEVYACSYCHGGVGETVADHFGLIDITDAEAVLEYVKTNQIDYVYSAGSDVAMPTVGKVSENCNLPCFIKTEIATICNDKGKLRETLRALPKWNINYQVLSDKNAEIELQYPFMMKPLDSQGQRGVCLIEDYEQFFREFDNSVSFSKEGKVIIEEVVIGQEVSVNTFSIDGKVVFEQVSDRIVWEGYSGGLIHKHLIPSQRVQEESLCEEMHQLVCEALKVLGLENGPAYFQIKVAENGPKIIEITPRLDGCHMWRLIEYYTGVNLLECSVRLLVGDQSLEEVFVNRKPVKKESYLTEFLCQGPETVFERANFDVKDAIYHEWYYSDGDRVKRMNGCKEKCGYQIQKQ